MTEIERLKQKLKQQQSLKLKEAGAYRKSVEERRRLETHTKLLQGVIIAAYHELIEEARIALAEEREKK